MKHRSFLMAAALMICSAAQATITCRFVSIQIDSNQSIPLDIDNDGTNDYILLAQYTPYVNNYLVGLNGNEAEVTSWTGADATRARRIESGDPVGTLAWNDTAYMIKNGQGSFSGGSEEYGHVGLRLNKSGSWHYAFLELRAPYWQALVAVYNIGYNDVAGAETRTDACPLVGVEEATSAASLVMRGKQLHVPAQSGAMNERQLLIFNSAGQTIWSEPLTQDAAVVSLQDFKSGIYVAAVMEQGKLLQRSKITLME